MYNKVLELVWLSILPILSFFALSIIFSAFLPLPFAIITGAFESPTSYLRATAKCVGLVIIAVAWSKLSIEAFSFLLFLLQQTFVIF